jgi:hypothetical protein
MYFGSEGFVETSDALECWRATVTNRLKVCDDCPEVVPFGHAVHERVMGCGENAQAWQPTSGFRPN